MLVSILLAQVAVASAADAVVIPDEIQCDTCEILLTDVAVLGGPDGDALLADFMGETVAVDREGNHWLFSYNLPTQIWRFDPRGQARIFGREGRGPREYWGIDAVGSTADGRVIVFDQGNDRLDTVAPDGDQIASVPQRGLFRGISGVAALSGDTVVVGAVGFDEALLGVPLHAIDVSTGELLASFGGAPPTYEAQFTQLYQSRRVSAASPTVAAGHVWKYQVDLFDWPSRSLASSYVRAAPWFRPVDLRRSNPPRTRPDPALMGIKLLGDGSAIVLLRRAKPTWREGFEERSDLNPESGWTMSALSAVYETVLEHLDLAGGRVLAREVVDGFPLAFVSDMARVALLDDRGLVPRVTISDVRVR